MYDTDYQYVAVGATQACGPNGKQGDRLLAVLCIPNAFTYGNVQIKDGAGSPILISSLAVGIANLNTELRPFLIEFGEKGIRSTAGGWSVICGANIEAIALGRFS